MMCDIENETALTMVQYKKVIYETSFPHNTN